MQVFGIAAHATFHVILEVISHPPTLNYQTIQQYGLSHPGFEPAIINSQVQNSSN